MSRRAQSNAGSTGFLRSTGIVTVAGIAAGFLQYAFHWYAARNLEVAAYGDVSALLSLVFMAGLPASVIQTAIAKSVAESAAAGRLDLARGVLRRSVRGLLWPAILVGGALSVTSPLLTRMMHAHSVWVVAVTGPVISLLILLPVWRGAAQGLRDFVALGLSQVFEGVVRLGACVALVALGAGAVGAMGASVAAIAAAIVAVYPSLRVLRPVSVADAAAEFRALKQFLVPVAAALCGYAAISNVDVAVVKVFFPSKEAADYAAAAVLGRSVLYISVAVTTVMLPVVAHDTARARRSRRVLAQSFVLSGLMCGACAAVLAGAADGIAVGVFGAQYASIAPLVRWYSLAMLPMVPLNTLVSYELGRGRLGFLFVLIPAAVAHTVLLCLCHTGLFSVIVLVATSGTVVSLLVAGSMFRGRGRALAKSKQG